MAYVGWLYAIYTGNTTGIVWLCIYMYDTCKKHYLYCPAWSSGTDCAKTLTFYAKVHLIHSNKIKRCQSCQVLLGTE